MALTFKTYTEMPLGRSTMELWINQGGTMLISDNFTVVVD
jgi:hypothetical protein